MSSKQFLVSCIIGWPVAVGTALAARATFLSASFSTPELAGWAFLAIAPIATVLIIARGRPAESIAKVLYDTEHAGDAGQKKPVTVPRG